MLFLWMGAIGLIVIGGALGRRLPVPEAVIWCALGFAAAFLPGYETFRLDPRITLYGLLPPLVFASSVQLPWPEFRGNLRPIGGLALWLVLANTVAVAAVAHAFAGFSWPVAVALGAVVSPTDPVAASAVASRVGLPDRLIAILEGEGLVNDAVALTLLRVATVAIATGGFSAAQGVERFLAIVVGEPLYGWAVGVAIMRLRSRIEDPRLEITVSLLTPFAAYLLPEHLGGSGILATVAAGMYVGERRSAIVPAGTRLHATSVWDVVVFLLNGILFLMAGMELRRVFQPRYLESSVLLWGLAVAATVIVVRALWCGAMLLLRGPLPPRQTVVAGWSGMRGPISLAAALSIPGMAGVGRFAGFEPLVFITAIVIVATLFVQGLTLPRLTRASGVATDAARDRRQEHDELSLGREEGGRAAMDRLAELEAQRRISAEMAASLRRLYGERAGDGQGSGELLRMLVEAERSRLRELRRQGRIHDRALEQLERSLDLRESAFS
jgi:CPA1 family monovalent cation:H+ antiporter